MAEGKVTELKKGGNPARSILYTQAAKYAPRAIDICVQLMEHGDNDNVKLGALKTILAKAIPDLHDVDLGFKDGSKIELFINVERGFIPAAVGLSAAPIGSITAGSTPLQSPSVAPESPQNDHGSVGTGQAGTLI